jgi:catechol 2,3-dioxygenase-like lactoylglutathione lyase family enzyme
MLSSKEAMATIAVKDIEAARKFYEGTLGLNQVPVEETGVLLFRSGHARVLVYESQYAGTNKATAATWVVGDEIAAVVEALKSKGVVFEKYDFPDTTREGDIHVTGTMKAAWCQDPDGNILALVSN